MITYYQLGGYRDTRNRWDSPFRKGTFDFSQTPKLLAEKVFSALETEIVTLVLGIEYSGASRLLLTEQEVRRICTKHNMYLPGPREGLSAESFESLSPIEFYEVDELAEKLSALAPKSRANFDNSKDNKSFDRANEGGIRGTFENGRLLRQVATRRLSGSDLGKFSLCPDVSALQSIRVLSLAYTLWAFDHRSHSEKKSNPTTRLLDLGVSEATLAELRPISGMSKNLIITNNANLKQPPEMKHLSFDSGETETLESHAISLRLRTLLSLPDQGTSNPVILLVHDSSRTKRILEVYGFETHKWKDNLKGLRDSQLLSRYSRTEEKYKTNYKYDHYESKYSASSKSRSGSSFSPRRGEESAERSAGAVYVVDIKELFRKMMKSDNHSETINGISQVLEIKIDNQTGWNAGCDAVSLLSIWQTMVDGRSIDEQHVGRREKKMEKLQLQTGMKSMPQPRPQPAHYDFDDDRNPNDQPQASTSSAQPLCDEDWSDYSED